MNKVNLSLWYEGGWLLNSHPNLEAYDVNLDMYAIPGIGHLISVEDFWPALYKQYEYKMIDLEPFGTVLHVAWHKDVINVTVDITQR